MQIWQHSSQIRSPIWSFVANNRLRIPGSSAKPTNSKQPDQTNKIHQNCTPQQCATEVKPKKSTSTNTQNRTHPNRDKVRPVHRPNPSPQIQAMPITIKTHQHKTKPYNTMTKPTNNLMRRQFKHFEDQNIRLSPTFLLLRWTEFSLKSTTFLQW